MQNFLSLCCKLVAHFIIMFPHWLLLSIILSINLLLKFYYTKKDDDFYSRFAVVKLVRRGIDFLLIEHFYTKSVLDVEGHWNLDLHIWDFLFEIIRRKGLIIHGISRFLPANSYKKWKYFHILEGLPSSWTCNQAQKLVMKHSNIRNYATCKFSGGSFIYIIFNS